MKKLLLSASIIALTGCLSTTAMAADFNASFSDPTGMGLTSSDIAIWGVGAFPGMQDDDCDTCDDFKNSAFGAGFRARTLYHYNPSDGVQFEGYGEYLGSMDDENGGDDDKSGGLIMGGAHFIHRKDDGGAWGLFAGFAQAFHLQEDSESTYILGGIEHAWMSQKSTYTAQFGGLVKVRAEEEDEGLNHFIFGEVTGRHFLSEQSSVEGSLAGGWGMEFEGDDEPVTWVQWGLEYEQGLGQGPLSVFGGYEGYFVSADTDNVDWTVNHAINLGLRLAIGAPSHQALVNYGSATFALPDLFAPVLLQDDLD